GGRARGRAAYIALPRHSRSNRHAPARLAAPARPRMAMYNHGWPETAFRALWGQREGTMRIIVGADHAGFALKGPVVEALRSWGHEVEDVGTYGGEPVDFPDVARSVCDPVRTGQ